MQDSGLTTCIAHTALERRFSNIEDRQDRMDKKIDKMSTITVRNGKETTMPVETAIKDIWESTRGSRNWRKVRKILADYPMLEKIIHYFKWGVFWVAALITLQKMIPESIPVLKTLIQLIK